MEVEEIHAQNCNKFPRVANGRNEGNKIGQEVGDRDHYPDDEDDGEALRMSTAATGGGSDPNKLRGWHNSSRIIRVSRASGGKDRHSKVWTSKGLRDRRVRLSVSTAIQFYDLQDRLGYDQPSKAVEWLIKAAADAISELPSLNSANFPDTPKQLSNEKRTREGFDSAEMEVDADGNIQNQHISLSKSASSTSETSKGSVLSLSRSEIRVNRVKARERARERAAKEKENESRITHHQNLNPISQNSSFTDLLTGCTSPTGSGPQNAATGGGGEPNLFHNYFGSGLRAHNFSGQIHMGNSNSLLGENHPELQHFSFVPDHLITAATSQPGGGNEYNLNFSISSGGLAGYNRGTLQSNSSPSLLPHLQRFSSPPIDGPNLPFFIGAGAPTNMENHHHQHPPHHPHQFPAGFDGRLQLCYGDGSRHSDHKGKGKN